MEYKACFVFKLLPKPRPMQEIAWKKQKKSVYNVCRQIMATQ